MNACWLGQTRRLLDQTTDAVAALDRGLGISLDGPFLPGEMLARAELARALVALGEHDQATEHLARCDKILAAGEDWRGRTGVVELARGAVAAARGEPEAAHAAYAHASEVFSAYRLP